MNTQFFTQGGASLITRIAKNKHTSLAALIYVTAKYGAKIGAIWCPVHAAQFEQTADLIESGSVAYGFIMAGDSNSQHPPPPEI